MKFILFFLFFFVGCSSAQKSSDKEWQSIGYTGTRWWAEYARLSSEQKRELADMTPGPSCLNCSTTWNNMKLRWEQDFQYDSKIGSRGPHAILPFAAAKAEQERKDKDAGWCDPSSGMTFGDMTHSYYCKPNANGPEGRKGRWEVDTQAEQQMEQQIAKWEHERRKLAEALSTRVLTDAELQEVGREGSKIFEPIEGIFNQAEVDREYQSALLMQQILRMKADKREFK